jgi:hypothetical protein
MANREQLKRGGLRAYEVGRLKAAARVGLVLLPAAALCLLENQAREACACLAVILVGLAVWLRWRDREGVESVTTGLIAGSLPLVAGLALDHLGLRCGFAGESSFCSGFALLAGGCAGAYIGTRNRGLRPLVRSWAAAATIAALAASLGCVRLGALGLASVVAGIGLGTVLTAVFRRRR